MIRRIVTNHQMIRMDVKPSRQPPVLTCYVFQVQLVMN